MILQFWLFQKQNNEKQNMAYVDVVADDHTHTYIGIFDCNADVHVHTNAN